MMKFASHIVISGTDADPSTSTFAALKSLSAKIVPTS